MRDAKAAVDLFCVQQYYRVKRACGEMQSPQQRPCGPCTRESDNKSWDCPPRMADGRLFTDYRPRCDVQLLDKAPAWGSFEHRQHLIHNADAVMQQHRQSARQRSYCGPCVDPYDAGTVAPEQDRFVCTATTCSRVATGAANGIGTGRDYGMQPSDKAQLDLFLTEQTAQQQRLKDGANCCACNGDAGSYPLPGFNAASVQQPVRWATPSGAAPFSGGDASVGTAACR